MCYLCEEKESTFTPDKNTKYLLPILINLEKEESQDRCYEFNTGKKRVRYITYYI